MRHKEKETEERGGNGKKKRGEEKKGMGRDGKKEKGREEARDFSNAHSPQHLGNTLSVLPRVS